MDPKKKLKDMARTDVSKMKDYMAMTVEEARCAFRLETRMFQCRANMPTLYRRDLLCRACLPDSEGVSGGGGVEETQEH